LDEVKEVIFQIGKWPIELICFQDVVKCDFREVVEGMIQDAKRPFALIFCIQDMQKWTDEFAEVMFQLGEWP
jgi:hypothetical protein